MNTYTYSLWQHPLIQRLDRAAENLGVAAGFRVL